MSDEEREFVDEEVLFRKDGTIVWRVDGQRVLLRRPKFKELRTLREEIADLAEQSREAREELTGRLRTLTGDLQDNLAAVQNDDPTAAEQIARIERELRAVQQSDEWDEVQAALREQRNDSDAALLGWFRDSILCRFGKPVPVIDDPEELPPWCIDQGFIRDLLDHWSSVPRRPGVV